MTKLAFKEIKETFKDIAGKWRLRVSISNDEDVFLKFQHNPSLKEVKIEIVKLIQNRKSDKQKESDKINERIKQLQEQKGILEKEITSEVNS